MYLKANISDKWKMLIDNATSGERFLIGMLIGAGAVGGAKLILIALANAYKYAGSVFVPRAPAMSYAVILRPRFLAVSTTLPTARSYSSFDSRAWNASRTARDCASEGPWEGPSSAPASVSAVDLEEQCRQGARKAFDAVATDKMTTEQGQAAVDKACKGVPAASRKLIVDAEREAAIARALVTP